MPDNASWWLPGLPLAIQRTPHVYARRCYFPGRGQYRSHKQDQFVLTTALCGELLGFHLGDEASLDEIAAFVEEARHDYRDANPPVDLLAIEASIGAVYGEDHLLDDISGDQQLQAQFQIIGKIVHQSESAKRNLDKLLDQAEELAEEWSQENG